MTLNKTLLLICMCMGAHVYGQSVEDLLKETYHAFEKNDSLPAKVKGSNTFDLIASKYPDQWIAHYYAAYSKTIVSYLLTNEKQRDLWLDQAATSIEKAKALSKGNEELLILEAHLANARLAVKPMSRYKKQGEIFDAKLKEAAAKNPSNPRIYFLQGLSVFHTPKAFGGGAKNALPYFEKAAPLFKQETKENISKPYWGEMKNAFYLEECHQAN